MIIERTLQRFREEISRGGNGAVRWVEKGWPGRRPIVSFEEIENFMQDDANYVTDVQCGNIGVWGVYIIPEYPDWLILHNIGHGVDLVVLSSEKLQPPKAVKMLFALIQWKHYLFTQEATKRSLHESHDDEDWVSSWLSKFHKSMMRFIFGKHVDEIVEMKRKLERLFG